MVLAFSADRNKWWRRAPATPAKAHGSGLVAGFRAEHHAEAGDIDMESLTRFVENGGNFSEQ